MPKDAIVEYAEELGNLTQSVRSAVDPERRRSEVERIIGEIMTAHPYTPGSETAKVERKIRGDQERVAGETLHALIEKIREDQDIYATIVARAKQAPTALEAFEKRYNGASVDSALQVMQLEELRIARYTRELVGASPSVVLDTYLAAVNGMSGGDDAESLIRFVEERLPRTWEGAARTPEEAVAVQQLARAIAKQQDACVAQTPGLAEWGEAIAAGRKAVTAARDLHRIHPRPPQRAISEEVVKAVDHVRTRTARMVPPRKVTAS